ncbi:hypothetical protein A6I77_24520 [Achromobacter xylosoxidans]|nr:hypothetical protein A6I77_24520 [Achromobacter xylosoxidans]
MYVVLNAPISVVDITPTSIGDLASGAVALLGALAAFFAAIIALYLSNRERADRAREKQLERDELKKVVLAVVEPEVDRLQQTLRELYRTICRARSGYEGGWEVCQKKMEWLESQISLPAIDRFLTELFVLDEARADAYSRMYGLLPSLLKRSEQLRIVPSNEHYAWEFMFSGLEFGIGNFAALLYRARNIDPGDPFFGELQTAKDKYEEQLK